MDKINQPLVSVIVPCKNEEKYIGKVIENIINQDYPKELLEVFIIDGISTDKTVDIINQYIQEFPIIKFLSNHEQTAPYALNYGIKASSGEIIIRMDAHSIYPDDYVSKLVYYLKYLNADNVGGVWATKPGNNSVKALAIAKATSSIFGIGNAFYRLENAKIRKVDTVPFGCYKKEVFSRIGYFDEDYDRNEDDEFNARLIKNGGKIYLIPEVKISYFARESLSKITKMFFQYGLFKPLVNKKIGRPATFRQFFPLGFVLYVLFLVVITVFHLKSALFISVLLGFYVFLNFLFSLISAIKEKTFLLLFYLPITFVLIHFSYGWGYLIGIFKFLIFNRKIRHNQISITR